jgi:hypothetical protein
MRTRIFRAVVIDDDETVLSRVRGRVGTEARIFEGTAWQVELITVRVGLERGYNGRYGFTTQTFTDLTDALAAPPDVLLLDYGFMNRERTEYWRDRHGQGSVITRNDLHGDFLTPVDLADAIQSAISQGGINHVAAARLKRHFLAFAGPLVLYTMASRPFVVALGEVEDRRCHVARSFKGASSVEAVDSNYEFYNREQFHSTKHDSDFYAHLISGHLDRVIQIKLLEAMLAEASNLKYVRVKRSVGSVGAVVALGAGIAAVADFLGSQITWLMRSGSYTEAALVCGFALLLVFAVGIALPFVFGKIMTGLLGKDEAGG